MQTTPSPRDPRTVMRHRAVVLLTAGVVFLAPTLHVEAAPAPAPAPAAATAPPAAADDSTPKAEDAGMWIGTAAVICLEQDASLKSTPFGAQLTQSPSYTAWRQDQHPAVLSCFAQAKLLSPALCKDIFAQPAESGVDHSRALFDKHAATIAHLGHMDDCISR